MTINKDTSSYLNTLISDPQSRQELQRQLSIVQFSRWSKIPVPIAYFPPIPTNLSERIHDFTEFILDGDTLILTGAYSTGKSVFTRVLEKIFPCRQVGSLEEVTNTDRNVKEILIWRDDFADYNVRQPVFDLIPPKNKLVIITTNKNIDRPRKKNVIEFDHQFDDIEQRLTCDDLQELAEDIRTALS